MWIVLVGAESTIVNQIFPKGTQREIFLKNLTNLGCISKSNPQLRKSNFRRFFLFLNKKYIIFFCETANNRKKLVRIFEFGLDSKNLLYGKSIF